MSEHAKLAPSAAKRWMTCPGSVAAEDAVRAMDGEPGQNPAAELGTALHEVAEDMIADPTLNLEDMIGRVYNGIEINDLELLEERIESYVAACREYVSNPEFDVYIEQRVGISAMCWGTADFIACDGTNLVVRDLKTGTGVRVEVMDNPQLLLYGLGAYYNMRALYPDIEELYLFIDQEALNNQRGVTVMVQELLDFERKVSHAFEQILTDSPPLVPSEEGCQWCLARATCPALGALVKEQTMVAHQEMSIQQLADALDQVPIIKQWIRGVEDRAKERLVNGKSVPGYKAVGGRRTRGWVDEGAAQRYLKRKVRRFKSTLFTEKFMTPAQVEKALRKAELIGEVDMEEIVVWREGKPTVAPESDNRPSIESGDRAAADFAGVVEGHGTG